jgi:hypothetical protein
MNYQPGTSDNANPTVVGVDWPVPFPDFRGNVWGPYDTPGDRFQKIGLLQTIQDLYLNGDLRNLYGDPIIKEDVKVVDLMNDPTFGLNFNFLRTVTLDTIPFATNYNILNAMRIKPNGFGTVSQIASGNGPNVFYTSVYQNGGGMGPSKYGPPPTGAGWTNNGIYQVAGSGLSTFSDPSASGYAAGFSTVALNGASPEDVDASVSGMEVPPTTPIITNRTSWYLASECIIKELFDNWTDYLIKEMSDTNLVLGISQAQYDISSLGSNQRNADAIFSCPIRLTMSSDTGTQKYQETLQGLLSNSNAYWEKRFQTPVSSMNVLQVSFEAYNGYKIPLEKMLQERRSVDFLRTYERVFCNDQMLNKNDLYFLYDPLNPQLIGRTKRSVSLIFQIDTYEYTSPGLVSIIKNMLASVDSETDNNDYVVAAFNS